MARAGGAYGPEVRAARGAHGARAATVLGASTLFAAGLFGTGCGAPASTDGMQACVKVESSLHLYSQATAAARSGRTAIAARDRTRALTALRFALPLASIAAGTDGSWQPLEATLSESNRVAESHLVTALSAECAGVVPAG